MELSQLRAFAAVARAGGFAAAAGDAAPSTMTRAVANLERALGVRLFQRTTRSVSLTEAGEKFLARIAPALDEIDAAAEAAASGVSAVAGALRVAASVSFGQKVIAPALAQFHDQYPKLSVELILSDGVSDLIAERIDVAVRHGALDDSALIAQRLADVRYLLVASPAYLEGAPPLASPRDLAGHACLTYPYPAFRSRWRFERDGAAEEIEIKPAASISNAAALASCVKSGMGVALLADWMVDSDIAEGALVSLLTEWTASGAEPGGSSGLWIVTPSRQFTPAKTKAFADFMRTLIGPRAPIAFRS